MEILLKKIKNKKGFVSIETVVSMTFVILILCLFFGFIAYQYPKIILEQEVHALAQKCKIQGGLTDKTSQKENSDIEVFKDILENKGYSRDTIKVVAKTNPGNNSAIGVTPLNVEGDNYVKRDAKTYIEIIVSVPSNKKGLTSILKVLGISDVLNKEYVFKEKVLSERW